MTFGKTLVLLWMNQKNFLCAPTEVEEFSARKLGMSSIISLPKASFASSD